MPRKVPRFESEYGFSTTKERSNLMKKIRSKNTRPEVVFRKALWANGIRYRLNVKTLSGTPDIVIRKNKIAIFIDGEFWHGYNWIEKRNRIKNNKDYWIPKIERNMERDKEVNESLTKNGYRVLRFWMSQVYDDLDGCIEVVLRNLV